MYRASKHSKQLFTMVGTAVVGLALATGGAGNPNDVPVVKPKTAPGVLLAHPIIDKPVADVPPEFATVTRAPSAPLPVIWPVASGPFVNFETFPVKGLALNSDGTRLYAVNTPNNSVTIIDTLAAPAALPGIVAEIPVGLDPVSVAIQPNTADEFLWVANFISDDVSVIDTTTNTVEAVIDVGNEPATILFSPDGAFAYVVLQGNVRNTTTTDVLPYLVTIDTATRQVVHELKLKMNAARTAVIEPGGNRLVIAAMHSGNNKTLAGIPVPMRFTNDPNEIPTLFYSLQLMRDFSVTNATFTSSPLLSPYPDTSIEPNPPLVPRVVPDAGSPTNAWQQIVDLLTLPDGSIDPAVAAQFAAQFGVTNATEVLTEIAHDVKDTIDNDLAVIDLSNPAAPAIANYIGGVGTTLMGIAMDPAGDRVLVANTESLNDVRLVNNLVGHMVDHRVTIVANLTAPLVTVADLHAGIPNFNKPVPDGAPFSLAQPTDIVFSADGTRAYVAASGPGRVGVLNNNGRVLSRVDVGPGPRSLALDDARSRLYVLNRNNMSISTVDVAVDPPAVMHTLYLFNPEPAVIKNGRQFANSTRFSPNFATSCATCHVNMHHDHLAWDLGDPNGGPLPAPSNVVDPNGNPRSNHPMKGPMFTLSLRGLAGHNNFHWRGDKPMLQDFNETFRKLFGGTELSQSKIDAMAAYIDTIEYAPPPHYTRTNQLETDSALNGAGLYVNRCNVCHSLTFDGTLRNANGQDDAGLNLGGIFAQIQEITQLRQIEKKFNSDVFNGYGLIHDGRETREPNDPTAPLDPDIDHPLQTFLKNFFTFTASERSDLIEFMTAFPTNTLPVVGWEVRITSPSDTLAVADINTMIAQNRMNPSQNDVVARGLRGGQETGFVLLAADPNDPNAPAQFMSDTFEVDTLSNLLASLQPSDVLVFMAVPPGSGTRIGIDWDLDCILNGLDVYPAGTPDLNGDNVVDISDLGTLLAHFGQSQVPRELGDVTGDGHVNLSDLGEVLARFGQTLCETGN